MANRIIVDMEKGLILSLTTSPYELAFPSTTGPDLLSQLRTQPPAVRVLPPRRHDGAPASPRRFPESLAYERSGVTVAVTTFSELRYET